MSNKKWLVALISVDEKMLQEDLPARKALTSLPGILDSAVEGMSPSGALELERVYLHDDKEKDKLIAELEKLSVPYHVYATETCGEVCTQPFCTHHQACVVISINDYRH